MNKKLVLSLIALAAPAGAQPVEHPSQVVAAPRASVTLALDLAGSSDIDGEALRAALEAELGVTIVAADGALGRLLVMIDGGAVRVAFDDHEGTRIERTLALPASREDRVQLIAFVATNLVRDQASEILATLHVPPPQPAPVAVPPPQLAPPSKRVPATIGLIPPVAADRFAGTNVIVGVGVHGLVGTTDGSELASISGIVDVQRRFARGVQVAGIGAISGGDLRGIQVGGVGAVTGNHALGIQVGGIGAISGAGLDGAQVGGVASITRGRAHGLQVGGVATYAHTLRGMQVGGVASIANRVEGIQIAGVTNVGGDVSGMQVGVVNVAKRMRGVQVGVVNITENGDDSIPIGLINYARNGRVEMDGWIESTKLSAIALRHGPRRVHNLIALAWSPDHEHTLAGFGLGFHGNLTSGARPVTIDIDAVNWWTDLWHGEFGQLDQLRATIAIPVGPVDAFACAAANIYISNGMDESANFHPVMARRLTDDTGLHVVSWPSVCAGVRAHVR